MRFAAELQSEPKGSKRAAEREQLGMRAGFRKRGYETTKVDILDISRTGFKADCSMALSVGAEVWLKLPNLEPKVAQVVWVDGFMVGCKFEAPFYDSVFDDFVRRLKTS